jgi:hypothetical protein
VLNSNWFVDLADAQEKIELRRRDYNEVRPHSSWDISRRLSTSNSAVSYVQTGLNSGSRSTDKTIYRAFVPT